ncbi:MAG: aspartate aminotransferase family protein [Halobacteriales archaeon]
MTDDVPGPPREIATKALTPDTTNLFPREFTEFPEIVRGDGPYIYDRNGTEYFDAIAGNQCSNIGHGVEAIAEAAHEQLTTLEYASSVLFVNERAQSYTAKLAEFLPPGFEHTWLVSGGSEANESAIKLAREYQRECDRTERTQVIGRRIGYHGGTLGTLAATGMPARREPYVPMFKEWPKAPAAYPYRCRFCADEATCRDHGVECAKELERVIQDVGAEYVAAFIAEPVVGAANAACVPGEDYFETVRAICDEYNVLFIADEIMCGMGRTGANFAIEHWDVTPDIITAAKGMSAGYTPLGGMMPHEEIVEVFNDKAGGFTHGHTYAFNPTSAAIAEAVLDYMDRHDVVANARDVGGYVRERFEEFYEYDFVGDVRGKGLMLGVEFVEDTDTKAPLANGGPEFREQLLQTALTHGVTVYPGGGSVDGTRGDHVLITPPLTITRDQADEMMTRLHATFEAMASHR